MTPSEIARVESTLSVTLPARYARFLRECQFPPEECDLFLTADMILEENQGAREVEGWEDRYLAIGNDGCGNLFCLKITTGSEAVWLWEHDPPNGFRVMFEEMDSLFAAYEA